MFCHTKLQREILKTACPYEKVEIFELNKIDVIKKEKEDDRNINFPNEEYYYNLKPKCEPQLGKYKIYEEIGEQEIGGKYDIRKQEMRYAIFWVLNYSDGNYSLKEISQRSKIKMEIIKNVAKILEQKKLIKKIEN